MRMLFLAGIGFGGVMENQEEKRQQSGDNEKRKASRSKGGRPKLKIKKEHVIHVRLTSVALFRITEKARKAGVTVSAFIRRAALDARVTPRWNAEQAAAYRTLAGMANNLNQLARAANASGTLSLTIVIRRQLSDVEALMQELKADQD